MKKSTKRLFFGLGIVFLIGLILLVLTFSWLNRRGQAFNARPLVLIHAPLNNKRLEVGDLVTVHATAREEEGLERMELWVDNQLVESVDAEGQTPTTMVLSSQWLPKTTGHHLIIVRARSSAQITGQSSIRVFAGEAAEAPTVTHLVEEGETITSIAEEYGLSPEELEQANPELEDGGPAPGDGLTIPDSEPPSDQQAGAPLDEDADPADEGADPPDEEAAEPPIPDDEPPLMSILAIFGELQLFGSEAEMIPMRVELTQLKTNGDFTGLHCYIGLAGGLPQWYPDGDQDQATDESFYYLGEGEWQTEPFLVGETAPLISWPGDQPLPFTLNCVGISGGGTEAVDLGSLDMEIDPLFWDGTTHRIQAADGSMSFSYRISRIDTGSRIIPMTIDPDMNSPYNVRLNEEDRLLEWDYDPDEEQPIDGFRIYLNGNLQWVEDPEARETGIPSEWFNPPCGSTYTFGVSAFEIDFPDGPESYPGLTIINQPLESCNKEILITFQTLETHDLGGDGRYEDRHGDIGPVYGTFFANDQQITFDGGHERGHLDKPNGLSSNATYDLWEISADPTWQFSGPTAAVVDVPPGGIFEFGFQLMDRDTGPCDESGDPGCDDLICEGISIRYEDNEYGALDQVQEGALISDDGRCWVYFHFEPTGEGPVGTGVAGQEPLPWLHLVDYQVTEGTGEIELTVRNTGTGSWPGRRDLDIELQSRSGDRIGFFTWEEFELGAGDQTTLTDPDMYIGSPYDACVVIDPNDTVLEEAERNSTMVHQPICPDLPDLMITNLLYQSGGPGNLQVEVHNNGSGAVQNREITLTTSLPGGSPLGLEFSFPGITLAAGESRWFSLPDSNRFRDQMAAGYRVTVDPYDRILERDEGNNHYDIGEATRLWLNWRLIQAPTSVGHIVEFDLEAYVLTGTERRQVANWRVSQDIDWPGCRPDSTCLLNFNGGEFDTGWFDIYGDEYLEVIIKAEHPHSLSPTYTLSEVFSGPEWGAAAPYNNGCDNSLFLEGGTHTWYFDWSPQGNAWLTRFNLCRENAER